MHAPNLLKTKLQKKSGLLSQNIVYFHPENSPANFNEVVVTKLAELNFQSVRHFPYSPDLAFSDK